MRVATWNVNSVAARAPRLRQWLESERPDVLCLQETKCAAAAFPASVLDDLDYELAAHGEGRWNGVAIVSRIGLADVTRGFPGQPSFRAAEEAHGDVPLPEIEVNAIVEARAIGATCGPLRIWSVYVPNGRALGSAHFAYKLEWLDKLRTAMQPEVDPVVPFVVAGDFNVARTDADVWDPTAFTGSTHVTPAERDAVAAFEELGLSDILPRAMKHDTPFTYWDYRAGMFHKNQGMRIDLVLANEAFARGVKDAYVDRDARKGKGPSDHAPVVVDVDL